MTTGDLPATVAATGRLDDVPVPPACLAAGSVRPQDALGSGRGRGRMRGFTPREHRRRSPDCGGALDRSSGWRADFGSALPPTATPLSAS